MTPETQKQFGAYYTPPEAVRALVAWAVRSSSDTMLDPSCGDGRFLALHQRAVGVEQDPAAGGVARERAPHATIFESDFFSWATSTAERFDCAAGNPPFIRYQRFTGPIRRDALALCASLGARFTALTSSWAPFLVATAALLKTGGRMAFVVPAEIGHAPYAEPLLSYLVSHFDRVQLVAVREKVFPELSEDVWLLFADGFGGRTDAFALTVQDRFVFSSRPPAVALNVPVSDWHRWNGRLRPFVLPENVRAFYREVADDPATRKLREVARVGIGYVTGSNDFFHLRPSVARKMRLRPALLRPTVRNGRALTGRQAITTAVVREWMRDDNPVLLLDLNSVRSLPVSVRKYLDSPAGRAARVTYKCRNREPWYAVPDVTVPDAFLSYMSTAGPTLIANPAGCVGTNSVHTVRMRPGFTLEWLVQAWTNAFTRLGCEIEGHPLGGGMLKLEPGEAARVGLPKRRLWTAEDRETIRVGVQMLQRWRHHGG